MRKKPSGKLIFSFLRFEVAWSLIFAVLVVVIVVDQLDLSP
jgi:hypothetical protein